MKHARLSPSSSSRWLTCTASVKASEGYENKSNSAARWGTEVHYIGEQLLKGENIEVGQTLIEDGVGFTVDKERLDVAEDYTDYCRSLYTKTSEVLVEETFNLSSISQNQFGTSDCTIVDGSSLHVVDLKTGRNIVHAEDNTQMMLYAVGAVDYLEFHDIEEITLHIVQTRAGHISAWTLSRKMLEDFRTHAQEIAKKILADNVEFSPNDKACKWCPHQVDCTALATHVESVVKGAFDGIEDIDGQADKISIDHIKRILDNEALITGFIKAVNAVALERMEHGEPIKGYKLVKSRKNKAWRNKSEAEEMLAKEFGEDGFKKSIITPTQALKLGKQLMVDIGDSWHVPEGDVVLAPSSDKREAITSVSDSFEGM